MKLTTKTMGLALSVLATAMLTACGSSHEPKYVWMAKSDLKLFYHARIYQGSDEPCETAQLDGKWYINCGGEPGRIGGLYYIEPKGDMAYVAYSLNGTAGTHQLRAGREPVKLPKAIDLAPIVSLFKH
ncbi:hypothetical protein [Kordiimonas marina]|uniref:hypothetical protein n=1 Tax=Kordiimonas marina TaxID=2872312 RepID=UPI001FF3A79C|nr:hypothetical protein [Kordiimonas marina]MCJ9428534.1 hypothetical protein [Kordiimonas marina]